MPKEIPKVRIQMVASLINHGGRNALLIRKIFVNERIIKPIVIDILRKGTFDFEGEVIFLDRNKAFSRLKEAKLV